MKLYYNALDNKIPNGLFMNTGLSSNNDVHTRNKNIIKSYETSYNVSIGDVLFVRYNRRTKEIEEIYKNEDDISIDNIESVSNIYSTTVYNNAVDNWI